MEIRLDEPIVVMLAPDKPGSWLWGLFQFPKVWMTEDKDIIYRVNVGQDTYGAIGVQKDAWFYRSRDNGATWARINRDEVSNPVVVATLPDGSQVGIYPPKSPGYADNSVIDATALPVKPKFGLVSVNKVGYFDYYDYGDIPFHDREFPYLYRQGPEKKWGERRGVVDFPGLLFPAVTRSRLGQQSEWQPVAPRIGRVRPENLIALQDGTLLSTTSGAGWGAGQAPDMRGRIFYLDYCIASVDGGKTWKMRSAIAEDKTMTTHGYGGGEDSLVILADGTLLCAMRTDMCALDDEASRVTMVCRSVDGGYTWSDPVPVAESSITPHLITLKDRIVALVHGRPGVHITVSENGGLDWNCRVRVVGSTYHELAYRAWFEDEYPVCMYEWRKGHESCSNTDVLKLNDESFLISYSDFNYRDDDGKKRKANMVRRVTVRH